MKKDQIRIKGRSYPLIRCNTLVIGSGAASLNAAYHLNNFGVKDIVLATETLGGGTSNNSGSDKQTYYKLSISGEGQDSVYEMARTLFSGGSMHGDIALVEAGLSVQEFFHLASAGVPFPHNTYGGYVGYKTDHDPKQRATSAGPWTSNQMYQKLLEQVTALDIPILDRVEIISLLTAEEEQEKRVIGAVAIDKAKADRGLDSLLVFRADNIIMGTGGPGGIYKTSVYPEGHLGSTGVALEAGASAVNLTEWQYGLSSIKFRWNVSGTYQQVIPRYISTEADGSDQQEFLNQYFPTMGKLATAVFLKGYQWPFDVRKIGDYGSSLIDILVYQETVVKGRRVFMDFRHNPGQGDGLEELKFEDLGAEAYDYLEKSQALFGTPIERLEQMNPMAIELYQQHGIDLREEPLEVAVCAQHNNGGLKGNIWWESDLKHLFPVGEANGSHGVYRPGGTALNSGQVGGYRAAQYIANAYSGKPVKNRELLDNLLHQQVEQEVNLAEQVLKRVGKQGQDMQSFRDEIQTRMTETAAHIRDSSIIKTTTSKAEKQYNRILDLADLSLETKSSLIEYYQNRQLCLTQLAVLKSIDYYLDQGGGSRGSYLILDDKGEKISDNLSAGWRYRTEQKDMRKYTLEYRYEKNNSFTNLEEVRQIPEDNYWFEKVWKEYLAREIFAN